MIDPNESFTPPTPPWRHENIANVLEINNSNNQMSPLPSYGATGEMPGVFNLMGQALKILRENIIIFLGILLIPSVVQVIFIGIFSLLSGSLNFKTPTISLASGAIMFTSIAYIILMIVLNIATTSAIIYVILNRTRKIGILEAYKNSFNKIILFIGVSILLFFIVGGGYALFVIPGIIFMVWFCFSIFIVVDEHRGGFYALLKSREYARSYALSIFWKLLVFGIVVMVVSLVLAIPIGIIASVVTIVIISLGSFGVIIFGILSLIFGFVLSAAYSAFGTIFMCLIYEFLKSKKSGSLAEPIMSKKYAYLGISALGWLLVVGLIVLSSAVLLKSSGLLNKNSNGTIDENTLKNLFQLENSNSNIDLNSLFKANTNSNGNLNLLDTDNDGLIDAQEKIYSTNILLKDTDSDSLDDLQEIVTYKTDPLVIDTDKDGFRDGDEVANGFNPIGEGMFVK